MKISIPLFVIASMLSSPLFAAKGGFPGGGNGGLDSSSSSTSSYNLQLPSDPVVEASGADGAVVNFSVTATDSTGNPVSVSCTPASGSQFALGTTQVSCSTGGRKSVRASGSFSVSVIDTQAPQLQLPETLMFTSADGSAVAAQFVVSAQDIVSGSVNVQCIPASGSLFAVGSHSVSCYASDAVGNTEQGSFSVVVNQEVAAATDTVSDTTVVDAGVVDTGIVDTGIVDTTVVDTAATAPVVDTAVDTATTTATTDTLANAGSNTDVSTQPVVSSVTVSWVAPTSREDGAALATTDIASYEIYIIGEFTGLDQRIVVNDPNASQYTVDNLPTDTYHFFISVVDTSGLLSAPSDVVSLALDGSSIQ